MLNMADSGMEGLTGGGGGGGMEVLNDFAQMCMLTAERSRGKEWLVNKATETGYENLTQFFIQYFHEGYVSLRVSPHG
jgi:hypothetical protein